MWLPHPFVYKASYLTKLCGSWRVLRENVDGNNKTKNALFEPGGVTQSSHQQWHCAFTWLASLKNVIFFAANDRWPEIWYILNSSCKSSHCCQCIESVASTWWKSTFYFNFYSAKIIFILKKFLTFQENAPHPSKPRNIFEVYHVGKN